MPSENGSSGDDAGNKNPEEADGMSDDTLSGVIPSYSRRWAEVAWFLTGALLSFGLVSPLIVGLIVVIIGIGLTLFTARRVGPLGVGAALIGMATTPILVGLVSWGTSRSRCSEPSCDSTGAAVAWLLLGALFAGVGLAMLVIERRRRTL